MLNPLGGPSLFQKTLKAGAEGLGPLKETDPQAHAAGLEGLVDQVVESGGHFGGASKEVRQFAEMAKAVSSQSDSVGFRQGLLERSLAFAIAGSVPGSPGVALAKHVSETGDGVMAMRAVDVLANSSNRAARAEGQAIKDEGEVLGAENGPHFQGEALKGLANKETWNIADHKLYE